MKFFLALIRVAVGMGFGFVSGIAVSLGIAAFTGEGDNLTPLIAVSSLAILGSILAVYAPTFRRAFGRCFLLLGSAVFILPISALMLSGRVASDMVGSAEQGSEALTAIGAGAAGVAVTGLASFVGFFLGAILLMTGLVLSLGGRREVVIVERETHKEPPVRRG